MDNNKTEFIAAIASLAWGEAGKTGGWRSEHPVVDHTKCIPYRKSKQSCFLCWLYCPEGVIKKTIPLEIDLSYCKGCGICAAECPTNAIHMESEE